MTTAAGAWARPVPAAGDASWSSACAEVTAGEPSWSSTTPDVARRRVNRRTVTVADRYVGRTEPFPRRPASICAAPYLRARATHHLDSAEQSPVRTECVGGIAVFATPSNI